MYSRGTLRPIQSPLNVLSQDYPSRSVFNNSVKLQNMYLEKDEGGGGIYSMIGITMPKLAPFSLAAAEGRAMINFRGIIYIVRGNQFGFIDSSGNFTQIGTNLSTSSGFAKIVTLQGDAYDATNHTDNNLQIVIFDSVTSYYYNVVSTVYQFPITSTDVPTFVQDAISTSEYILVSFINSAELVYNTNPGDGSSWDALSFLSKNARTDKVMGQIEASSRVFIFGTTSSEVRFVGTNALLPFELTGDGTVSWGIPAVGAKIEYNGMVYTLSTNIEGNRTFHQWAGGTLTNVSNPARDNYLDSLDITNVRAVSYGVAGHTFIDWVFPTNNIIMTYDITTGVWLETSRIKSSVQFLPIASAKCYGKVFLMDSTTGSIYQLVKDVVANDYTMLFSFSSPPIQQNDKLITIHRACTDIEGTVDGGTFTQELSTDGGSVWDLLGTYNFPTNRTQPVYEDCLGQASDTRIRLSSNSQFKILGITFKFSIESGII